MVANFLRTDLSQDQQGNCVGLHELVSLYSGYHESLLDLTKEYPPFRDGVLAVGTSGIGSMVFLHGILVTCSLPENILLHFW
jgi:hypothetical protein